MNNAATDFEGWSRWLTKVFRPGVATGWSVTQRGSGANMSVDISVGDGVPMTTNTAAWDWTTAVENVAISAASANNRRDIVVAYTDVSVTNPSTATPNNPGALKFTVVQGTPATSPSDPSDSTIQAAVGASNPYLKLARVSLTSSTTQITNAQITSLATQMALQNVRLWGGSSNTLGHQIPNQADAFTALSSRSDGKVDYAALLSTIFSGQVQNQSNAGTAGGTIYFLNLGGVKVAWGTTASLPAGNFTITLPTSFFTAMQSVIVVPTGPYTNTNAMTANLTAAVSGMAATITFTSIIVAGANPANPYSWFAIGS
jgi:hypothetical protein